MYDAGETTVHALRTAGTCGFECGSEAGKSSLKNPLYEHSENNTKILGGRNERITENQNQA